MERRRIVLLGATGNAGLRVLRGLLARGETPTLVGRNRTTMVALANRFQANAPVAQLDSTSTGDLARLLEPTDVVISTVGPFMQLGLVTVAAAVQAGAHYSPVETWARRPRSLTCPRSRRSEVEFSLPGLVEIHEQPTGDVADNGCTTNQSAKPAMPRLIICPATVDGVNYGPTFVTRHGSSNPTKITLSPPACRPLPTMTQTGESW
ncbi:NAD(P)H-binding protein [Rhodococcus sp. WAY2]|uniref:NAD(P)H-binding protein n=1 Tax=Rhodococcus sp. WAY2 TaxID=2663121 RepID=UPI0013580AAC